MTIPLILLLVHGLFAESSFKLLDSDFKSLFSCFEFFVRIFVSSFNLDFILLGSVGASLSGQKTNSQTLKSSPHQNSADLLLTPVRRP